MSTDAHQTESALNFVSKSLRARLPFSRRFFMAAIPVTGSPDKDTAIRTDCAHAPKDLAKILREIANLYDPQN